MWYTVYEKINGNDRHLKRHGTYKLRTSAYAMMRCMENRKNLFVKKSEAHPDPDIKQYKCPHCGNSMSERELNKAWDWSGPHCNKCGCTGMTMFSAVSDPVISARSGM